MSSEDPEVENEAQGEGAGEDEEEAATDLSNRYVHTVRWLLLS